MSVRSQAYLDAACQILDEHGPADLGLGLTAAAMAAGSGLSRATVYQHWDTVEALNQDLAHHAIADRDGWQRRIVRQPVDEPLGEVVQRCVVPDDEVGIWARCSLLGWPTTSPLRSQVRPWEAQWLDAFAGWLDAHVAAAGRAWGDGTPRLAAVALTCVIEGQLLLDQVWSLPGTVAWYTGRSAERGGVAQRVIDLLTVPAKGDVRRVEPATIGALPDSGIDGAKRRALERALEASHHAATGDPAAFAPGRLVAPLLLARRLGVSERSVYKVWPTATEANVAALTAIGDRAVHTFTYLAERALDLGIDASYSSFAPMSVSAYDFYVRTAIAPGRIHTFACTTALRDLDVRRAFVATTERASLPMRRTFLALLAVTGHQPAPGVALDDYLGTLRAAVGGAQRLATLHPDLLDEPHPVGEGSLPLLAAATNAVVSSMLEVARIGRSGDESASPTLEWTPDDVRAVGTGGASPPDQAGDSADAAE